MTRAEAQSMVDAAARAGRIGMTAFKWRFTAAMQQFHSTVAEGVVGRVFNLAAPWFGSRLADEKAASSRRQDRAQAGHGAMGDMGVHVIDLIRRAPRPGRARCRARVVASPRVGQRGRVTGHQIR
jgi:predicted dehydrogenase